jgi:hypothetical protein
MALMHLWRQWRQWMVTAWKAITSSPPTHVKEIEAVVAVGASVQAVKIPGPESNAKQLVVRRLNWTKRSLRKDRRQTVFASSRVGRHGYWNQNRRMTRWILRRGPRTANPVKIFKSCDFGSHDCDGHCSMAAPMPNGQDRSQNRCLGAISVRSRPFDLMRPRWKHSLFAATAHSRH